MQCDHPLRFRGRASDTCKLTSALSSLFHVRLETNPYQPKSLPSRSFEFAGPLWLHALQANINLTLIATLH